MILSFRHKGLRRFYEKGIARDLPAQQVPRIRRILTAIDEASAPGELGLFPGWRLRRLRGDMKGFWSLTVTGNWRIIFRFEDGDAHDLNFVDYH